MKLNVERIVKKEFELTDDEIATLKKAQKIVDDISKTMENMTDEGEFEVCLKNKTTREETTWFDLEIVSDKIENLLNSEISISEY